MTAMSSDNWNQNPTEPNGQRSWGSSWDAVGGSGSSDPASLSQQPTGPQGPIQPDVGGSQPLGSASEPSTPVVQPSGPGSQPSASQPGGRQEPAWGTPRENQWQTGWNAATPQPGTPPYAEQQPGQVWQTPAGQGWQPASWTQTAPGRPQGTSAVSTFFKALFDLDFRRYVTPQIVRILYILAIIAVGLYWIGSVITLFAAARSTSVFTGQTTTNGGLVFLAVLDLLFGWIFALAAIALVRMQAEYILALIRTSEYARDIKAHLGAPDAGDGNHRPGQAF